MRNEDMQQVSADELLSQLSGSSDFGKDELVEMFAHQDDNEKDFCIYHRHKAFCVPLHKIREYFTRHKKPVPPMTKDQELIYLREKVKKLQDEAEAFQAGDGTVKPAPDEPEVFEPVEEPVEPTDDSGSGDMRVEPYEPVPPKRDESIPPSAQREKKSLKEIRADLAKELKDTNLPKKKVTDSAVSKGIQDREAEVDALLKKK